MVSQYMYVFSCLYVNVIFAFQKRLNFVIMDKYSIYLKDITKLILLMRFISSKFYTKYESIQIFVICIMYYRYLLIHFCLSKEICLRL